MAQRYEEIEEELHELYKQQMHGPSKKEKAKIQRRINKLQGELERY